MFLVGWAALDGDQRLPAVGMRQWMPRKALLTFPAIDPGSPVVDDVVAAQQAMLS